MTTPQEYDELVKLGERLIEAFALAEKSKKIRNKTNEQWEQQDKLFSEQFMTHRRWLEATDAEKLVPILRQLQAANTALRAERDAAVEALKPGYVMLDGYKCSCG